MKLSRSEARALPKVGFFAPQWSTFPNTENYPQAQDCIDLAWDETERRTVLAYMEGVMTNPPTASYRGFSTCRICNCHNGSRDYSDSVYLWPQGYPHYIEQHGVKPPQEFIHHILSRTNA